MPKIPHSHVKERLEKPPFVWKPPKSFHQEGPLLKSTHSGRSFMRVYYERNRYIAVLSGEDHPSENIRILNVILNVSVGIAFHTQGVPRGVRASPPMKAAILISHANIVHTNLRDHSD